MPLDAHPAATSRDPRVHRSLRTRVRQTARRGLNAILARFVPTAALLVHLGEVDARKLYLPAGYSSMHVYCVRELHRSPRLYNWPRGQ